MSDAMLQEIMMNIGVGLLFVVLFDLFSRD